MRIGIVGSGSIGASAAFARTLRGPASRRTMVDVDLVLTVPTREGDAAPSLPRVPGRGGALRPLDAHLDDAVRAALEPSVAVLRDVLARRD